MNLQLNLGVTEQKVAWFGTNFMVFQTFGTSVDDVQGRLLVGIIAFLPVTIIVFHRRIDTVGKLSPILVLFCLNSIDILPFVGTKWRVRIVIEVSLWWFVRIH